MVYLSLAGGWGQLYDLAVVTSARLRGARLVIHHHNFSYVDRASRLTRTIVAMAGDDQAHIALCNRMAELLKQRYPRVRKVVAVSNEAFWAVAEAAITRDGPLRRIGFLSNITAEKGIFRFLDLVAPLKARGVHIEALVAGPIDDPHLKQAIDARVEELGCVRTLGAVYGHARQRFFNDIDLLAFPTAYPNEAEPLVILEAQRSGVPVAASERGCIGQMIDEGTGLLLDRDGRKMTALVDLIARLSQDASAMKAMRENLARSVVARVERNAAARAMFLDLIRE